MSDTIGSIFPDTWSFDKLESLTKNVTDGSHFSPVPQEDGDLIANVKDMINGKINFDTCTRIRKEDFDLLKKQNCTPKIDDVLLSKDGTIGRVVLFTGTREIVVLSSIAIITPCDLIDSEFLKHVLQSFLFHSQLYTLQSGSALKRIVLRDINSLNIPYPKNLILQQKIACILSTCDEVIEKTEATIAKYKAIKQGMIQDLFTRGVDLNTGKLRPKNEDTPHLYKETELGWIPKEWEVKQIDSFLSLKSGEGITSISIQESGEFPVYGGNGLRGYTRSFTHEGDFVLIGRQGALCGNIVLADGKFYASEHAVVVSRLIPTNIKWLELKLLSMNLNKYSEASAQPGLSVNKINRLLIAIPQIEEQEKQGKRFAGIENRINTEQEVLLKYQEIKSGLMQDLLTGKVEVQVDEKEVVDA